jgi:phage terminase large subunit-like protein
MHFVTQYAKDVIAKRIIAGPHVRASCRRHIKDLKDGKSLGIYFDEKAANRIIEFSQEICCLNGGDFEGIPFDPLPWQKFILGSLFGWKKADGTRRFRISFIETSKGSGKSPLAALVGIYCLVADNEPRAEVYAAATHKDQAMVLFRDAVAMRNLSPYLKQRLVTSGTGQGVWNLAFLEKSAFFRPIASDSAQSGPRPHCVLLDEIHEHKNGNLIEMMRAGTKGRRQALIFMITNSGFDKQSVCWHYHEYATKVASGVLEDDAFFSYVCAVDKGDEPFEDEECWYKTNPSLGVTIKHEYIREQVTQAKGMPSKESVVRRLNFSQWVGASNPWLSFDIWMGAKSYIDESELIGRRCFGGLDLSSVHDLTALVLAFEPTKDDPHWRLLPFFWLPEDGLYQKGLRDGVDYLSWVKDGHLEVTPGKAIDKSFVCSRLAEISSKYNLAILGYDRWRIDDLRQHLQAEGININLQDFGQGFKDMAPAVDEFERRLIGGQMTHNGNPCLTWCAANAVIVSDPANNRKPAKDKSTGRIDGIVAAVMAIGKSLNQQEEVKSEIIFL